MCSAILKLLRFFHAAPWSLSQKPCLHTHIVLRMCRSVPCSHKQNITACFVGSLHQDKGGTCHISAGEEVAFTTSTNASLKLSDVPQDLIQQNVSDRKPDNLLLPHFLDQLQPHKILAGNDGNDGGSAHSGCRVSWAYRTPTCWQVATLSMHESAHTGIPQGICCNASVITVLALARLHTLTMQEGTETVSSVIITMPWANMKLK